MTDVCFSSDSVCVAIGCSDGTVWTLNLKTKKKDMVSTSHKPGIPIQSVQFNNNDAYLASATIDGLICIQSYVENQRGMI